MFLEDLRQASFRGVVFFINASSQEGGRKQITHEFMNTGRRIVQDIGDYKPVFEVIGTITNNGGRSYEQNRDQLLSALRTEGAGILSHPWYGSLNVTTGTYKLDENLRSLNRGTIRFTCYVVDDAIDSENGNPFTQSTNQVNESEIGNLSEIAKDSLGTEIADSLDIDLARPNNAISVESILQNVLNVYSDTLEPIADTTEDAIEYANQITQTANDISRLLNNPTVLISEVIDSATAVDGLTASAIRAYDGLIKLFSYGRTDATNVQVVSDTALLDNGKSSTQQIRKSNADQLVLMAQTMALIEAYNQAANIDFSNDVELQEATEQLDAQYDLVIDSLGPESADTLTQLRSQVRVFLDIKRVNVNFIREINVYDEPASVIAYSINGNTDDVDNILSPNDILDPASISGTR